GASGVNDGQYRICCVKTPPDRKGDEVYIQEKLDGCLHSRQPVMTDRGEIPVSTIVENQLPVQVLTYNEVLGIAEYKPIVAYFRQIRERPWLSVVVRSRVSGSQPRRTLSTDTPPFYREGAWVAARRVH